MTTKLLIMISCIILLGCAPDKVFVCPDGTQVSDTDFCKIDNVQKSEGSSGIPDTKPTQQIPDEADLVQEIESPKDIPPVDSSFDDETRSFLSQLSEIESYSYLDNNYVKVKDNILRIEKSRIEIFETIPYNTLHIDRNQNRTWISCLGKSTGVPECSKAIYQSTYTEVPYEKFKVKVALDYMNLRKARLNKSQSMFVFKTPAYKLHFTDISGRKGSMWVHNFYPFPLKISYEDGEEVAFGPVAINSLKDKDVQMPFDLKEYIFVGNRTQASFNTLRDKVFLLLDSDDIVQPEYYELSRNRFQINFAVKSKETHEETMKTAEQYTYAIFNLHRDYEIPKIQYLTITVKEISETNYYKYLFTRKVLAGTFEKYFKDSKDFNASSFI